MFLSEQVPKTFLYMLLTQFLLIVVDRFLFFIINFFIFLFKKKTDFLYQTQITSSRFYTIKLFPFQVHVYAETHPCQVHLSSCSCLLHTYLLVHHRPCNHQEVRYFIEFLRELYFLVHFHFHVPAGLSLLVFSVLLIHSFMNL